MAPAPSRGATCSAWSAPAVPAFPADAPFQVLNASITVTILPVVGSARGSIRYEFGGPARRGRSGVRSVQYVPPAFNASATVPTRIRLTAHTTSRLNQLRDTNVSPKYR